MPRSLRSLLPLTLVIVVLAGCASSVPSEGTTQGASKAPSPQPSPGATEELDPVELDPEALIGELRRYAADHPGEFGGVYMHPPGSGSFVMLFTDRLDEHAAALAEVSPRISVRRVRYTEAELLEVMEALDLASLASESVEPVSASLDTENNRVTLEVKTSDPTLEVRLELTYGGRLEVIAHPMPGAWANETEGEGWRLLATGLASGDEAYTVRAATDPAEWEALWLALGLDVERPDVDLATEVVVSFAHGIGSSCSELRLDAVSIGGGVVYSVTSDPLAPRACTTDLVASVAFVVALERAALPADGFTLRLTEQRICGGADCGFAEEIEVDLP